MASGIGQVAARRFAGEGARVVGCDVRAGAAEAVAEELVAQGLDVHGVTADLGTGEGARAFIEQVVAALGGIDVLWNNAGANRPGAIDELTDDDWDFVIRNELSLVFHTSRAAWPY